VVLERLAVCVVTLILVTGCATSSVYRPVTENPAPEVSETQRQPQSALPSAIETGGGEPSTLDPQQDVPVAPSEATAKALSDSTSATLALIQQSDRAYAAGNAGEAVAYVERAIRLNPHQADLWLRLAELQLARDNPEAAVQFANKAISLAGQRVDWIRDAWLVIANARTAQGNTATANDIRARWRTYRG
jgi:tetratricopeptide (TPR) repeat protein